MVSYQYLRQQKDSIFVREKDERESKEVGKLENNNIYIYTKKSEGNSLLRDTETKTTSIQDILNKETVDM